MAEGLQQLIIIGAGYDTRAYRIPDVREARRVLEVDHPLTQLTKRETIRQIFGELPEVTYVCWIAYTGGSGHSGLERGP